MGAKGYSSIREAVSNSLRHSGASTVSVSLQEHGTGLRLAIEDDGVGFDPESRAHTAMVCAISPLEPSRSVEHFRDVAAKAWDPHSRALPRREIQ